jgi:hypothetical protein
MYDEEGTTFFYNKRTGTTHLTPPKFEKNVPFVQLDRSQNSD